MRQHPVVLMANTLLGVLVSAVPAMATSGGVQVPLPGSLALVALVVTCGVAIVAIRKRRK